jgi:hypothetical protein
LIASATRNPRRNHLILLLSLKAGLRGAAGSQVEPVASNTQVIGGQPS